MITITIGSFKGGTSKTTSSLNIGYILSLFGKNTLLIDLDPQGNLTSYIGCSNKTKYGIGEVLYEKVNINDILIKTKYKGLCLLPSSKFLENYREFNISILSKPESILNQKLGEISESFDFCIMDTPPSLGLISKMAFLASDYVIPCIGMDPFSILGLQTLFSYIDRYHDILNTKILGIITSFWEKRSSMGRVLNKILYEKYSELLFNNKIHKDVSVSKSIIQETPLAKSFSKSRVSKDYFLLTKEILERIGYESVSEEILSDRL